MFSPNDNLVRHILGYRSLTFLICFRYVVRFPCWCTCGQVQSLLGSTSGKSKISLKEVEYSYLRCNILWLRTPQEILRLYISMQKMSRVHILDSLDHKFKKHSVVCRLNFLRHFSNFFWRLSPRRSIIITLYSPSLKTEWTLGIERSCYFCPYFS